MNRRRSRPLLASQTAIVVGTVLAIAGLVVGIVPREACGPAFKLNAEIASSVACAPILAGPMWVAFGLLVVGMSAASFGLFYIADLSEERWDKPNEID